MTRAVLLFLCVASSAGAQGGRAGRPCTSEIEHTTDSTRAMSITGPDRKVTVYYGGGLKATCKGTTMRITGDSAEFIQASRFLTVIGHVHYSEDTTKKDATTMTSNVLQYFDTDAHIVANGNVVLLGQHNSKLTGEQMIYYRIMPGVRTYTSAIALGKPHAELRDSAGTKDSAATLIDADRLYMERDSLFFGGGQVIVTRPDIIATADSMRTDTRRQTARLVGGSPHIEGRGAKPFSMDGTVLDIFGRERKIDRLLASGKGVAVSDSMKLSADTLDLRMSGDKINHVVASGPGRARATSPERDIAANRIELFMPGGKMRRLLAYGRAHADTRPDSLVHSNERDWLEGDTLTADFDSVATADTNGQPALRLLVAKGSARSYYQTAPKVKGDSASINYVIGKQIDLSFKLKEIDKVRVTGQVRGMNIEPMRADTTKAKSAKPVTPPRVPPPKRVPPPQTPSRVPPDSRSP